MRKYISFVMMALCILSGAGCAGFSQQPVFTDIAGNETQPVKLVEQTLTGQNMIHLRFSGTAELTAADVFLPDREHQIACSIAKIDAEKDEDYLATVKGNTYTEFAVSPSEAINAGETFMVRGSVSDCQHSVLDFVLPFKGLNAHPARLRITELRPFYSSKPKSEFIEFVVTEAGNLAGLVLMNVGDKKNPHYTFPSAEVSKGEVIVYHWRSIEENICDELSAKIVSGGTQACAAARDFWGPYKSVPKRSANAVLLKDSTSGIIQDAVLYCTKKEFEKRKKTGSKWDSELLEQTAEAAVVNGVWQGGQELSGAVIADITASKSLAGSGTASVNNAAAWKVRSAKKITMGKAY